MRISLFLHASRPSNDFFRLIPFFRNFPVIPGFVFIFSDYFPFFQNACDWDHTIEKFSGSNGLRYATEERRGSQAL